MVLRIFPNNSIKKTRSEWLKNLEHSGLVIPNFHDFFNKPERVLFLYFSLSVFKKLVKIRNSGVGSFMKL